MPDLTGHPTAAAPPPAAADSMGRRRIRTRPISGSLAGPRRKPSTTETGRETRMEREIVQLLHQAVTDTAGVAGLVPTLKTSLSRLRQGRGPTPSDGGGADVSGDSLHVPAPETNGDGVSITVHGDEISVVLDITATARASVLATALAVRAAASQVLEVTHPGRHTVTVNVLGLEQADESPRPSSTQRTNR